MGNAGYKDEIGRTFQLKSKYTLIGANKEFSLLEASF